MSLRATVDSFSAHNLALAVKLNVLSERSGLHIQRIFDCAQTRGGSWNLIDLHKPEPYSASSIGEDLSSKSLNLTVFNTALAHGEYLRLVLALSWQVLDDAADTV